MASLALLAGGCTLTASGLDDYRIDDCASGDITQRRDLFLSLQDFAGFDEHELIIELVNDDPMSPTYQEVVAVAIVSGAPTVPEGATFDRRMMNALPPGTFRADIFYDLNDDAAPQANEPQWRVNDVCNNGALPFSFASPTMQVLDDPPAAFNGKDFEYHLLNFAPNHGSGVTQYELRLVETRGDSKSVVGYYFLADIPEASDGGDEFVIFFRGVVRPGTGYDVDHFADADRSTDYTPPTADHAWRDHYVANDEGLNESFEHNFMFVDVGDSI